MKKHLLGLGIFSFIVVSFAVAFAFIYSPKIPIAPRFEEVQRPVFETDKRKRCVKNVSQSESIELIQPTIENESRRGIYEKKWTKYKVFDTSVKKGNLQNGMKLAFHFFIAENGKVRYLASEEKEINEFVFQQEENVFLVQFDLDKWSEKLSEKYNFYVIPQIIENFSKIEKMQPKFNADKAFPVLLTEGTSKTIYSCGMR